MRYWIGAPWVWMSERWYRDRWVLVDGERIVLIASPGSQGAPREKKSGRRKHWIDGAALLPALVNAHTHLELGALRGCLPSLVPMTFWAAALQKETARWGEEAKEIRASAVRSGARELLADGVATVVDIGNSDASAQAALADEMGGIRLIFRQELIGWENPSALLSGARKTLEARAGAWDAERAQADGDALAAHAPHTCHPDLLRLIAGDPALYRGLLTIHAAEGVEEGEFLSSGGGPWKSWYERAGIDTPIGGPWRDAWHLLSGMISRKTRTLLVHANLLGEDSLREIASAGVALVHCPLSHRFFGHIMPPLRTWARLGIPIALGSDSLASASTLSLWENMRELHRTSGIAEETLLHWATIGGARAIGLAGVTGALSPGHSADLQLVAWDSLKKPPQLLRKPVSVWATFVRGKCVFLKSDFLHKTLRSDF